jgi:hypothetical protein
VHTQKKLEDELSHLDARFEARKRKFVEDSEKFRRELKRVSACCPLNFVFNLLSTLYTHSFSLTHSHSALSSPSQIQDNPPTSWKKPQLCLSPKDVPQPIENPKFKKL